MDLWYNRKLKNKCNYLSTETNFGVETTHLRSFWITNRGRTYGRVGSDTDRTSRRTLARCCSSRCVRHTGNDCRYTARSSARRGTCRGRTPPHDKRRRLKGTQKQNQIQSTPTHPPTISTTRHKEAPKGDTKTESNSIHTHTPAHPFPLTIHGGA